MKLLITGFEPFAGDSINPSKEVAEKLSSKDISVHILPVSYNRGKKKFLEIINSEKPDCIISLGLNARAKNIHIEQTAYNSMGAKKPDEDGVVKNSESIILGESESKSTSLDVDSLVQLCCSKNIDCEKSNDPGRFICNMIYFLALSSKAKKALFVHLPKFSNMSLEKMVEAVKIIVEAIDISK
ncbi:MAG: pyroglutamyl-peptidase I [Bacilli bacterium]